MYKLNLKLFSLNVNKTTDTAATTGNELLPEMKTYYSDYLIDLAEPLLVHDQFGQKHPIPKNGGKTIEFRKYTSLPKLYDKPLQEGVTPDGQSLDTSIVTATVAQYGGYITLSDVLLLTAIDNNLVQATELLASQAGRTLDTVTREELVSGTNVQRVNGRGFRYLLSYTDAATNDNITVDEVRKAVRSLKVQNAQKINGSYVAIIHPDVAFDLMSDSKWVNVKTYSDPKDMYEGEIGKIEGVRFVETTEAKIFHAENLTAAARNLTVKTNVTSSASVAVKEAISATEATALAGRKVIISGTEHTIASASSGTAGSASITLSASVASISADTVIYPEGAGAAGRDVYATLVIGANAYGVTEVTGGGLQHIVKQLGSAGTEDPLNQRATAGWKAIKTAKILVEPYMVRIESTSSFNDAPQN